MFFPHQLNIISLLDDVSFNQPADASFSIVWSHQQPVIGAVMCCFTGSAPGANWGQVPCSRAHRQRCHLHRSGIQTSDLSFTGAMLQLIGYLPPITGQGTV